jgi:hypothetical protein
MPIDPLVADLLFTGLFGASGVMLFLSCVTICAMVAEVIRDL